MSEDKQLSFMQHLNELRSCLFKSVIGLLAAMFICFTLVFYFKEFVFQLFTGPALARVPELNIVFTEVTEMMGTYVKVSFYLALALSLPYIFYQGIGFVRPALTRSERLYVYIMLPSVAVFFLAGAAFAYFVLIPPAFEFLLSFGDDIAEPMIRVGNYVAILSKLIFWIGICFEIPVVMFFLARVGIVTPKWLAKYRKAFYIAGFVLGAIITPTMDPVNQTLVAVPIILLYELGIILARIAQRKRSQSEENAAAAA